MKSYKDMRDSIKSGDVIFFSPKSNFGWGRLITFWTKSKYSHVGMAITALGRVWLLEASEAGRVRLEPLSKKGSFTLIHSGVNFAQIQDIACERVGLPYDYIGAIKAAFKLPRKNKRYYCSELVADLIKAAGFDVNLSYFETPASLFNKLSIKNKPTEIRN